MKKNLPKLIAVVGPTASGKTDLAIALAKKFRGEIVSADSRQLYRGLEIGADIPAGRKVTRKGGGVFVVRGVRHHLLAILPPSQALTLAEYKRLAQAAIDDILKRGKVPILAGGTGLYVRSVVDNFEIPEVPPDMALRRKLAKLPIAGLYQKLEAADPAYAKKISPRNSRYIIRALEVMAATGRTFSELQKQGQPLYRVLQLGIKRPRAEMYGRIEARVDQMMRRGLLKEAKKLGQKYGWSLEPMTALGHRQLGEFLRGQIGLEAAVERIKRDTRHYAKRQLTWFRRDKRIRWLRSSAQAEKLVKTFLG